MKLHSQKNVVFREEVFSVSAHHFLCERTQIVNQNGRDTHSRVVYGGWVYPFGCICLLILASIIVIPITFFFATFRKYQPNA